MTDNDYPDQFSDEVAQRRAKEFNCDILYATDTTLQLDLDGSASLDTFKRQLVLLEDLGIISVWAKVEQLQSKSGNWHVILHLDAPLPIERRILLQALLGSDLKREALCLAGFLSGTQPQPILLFRPRTDNP